MGEAEEEAFKVAIQKGLYPKKCLACFKMGIRNCRYWGLNFSCQEFEKGEIEKLIEKFE